MVQLSTLLDQLGGSLVDAVHGADRLDVPIAGLSIHEPDRPARRADVLLCVAVRSADDLRQVADAITGQGIAAVLTRRLPRTAELRSAARRLGVPWVEIAATATWMQVTSAIRSIVDAPGEARGAHRASSWAVDLPAQLNAVADLIDAPVLLSDRSLRVVAYSEGHDDADRQRIETIVQHRTPERVSTRWPPKLFDELHRGTSVVTVPAVEPGMLPRAAVGVVAGDEPLGTLWAAVREPLDEQRSAAFLAAAQGVALTLLRMRTAASAAHSSAGVLAALLDDDTGPFGAAGRLGLAGTRFSVLGMRVAGGPGVRSVDAERARQRAAEAFALHLLTRGVSFEVATIGDTVYAVVGTDVESAERHRAAVRQSAESFVDGSREGQSVLLAIGRPVDSLRELVGSRRQSDQILDFVACRRDAQVRVAEIEDVSLDLMMARLAETTRRGALPRSAALARLAAYDAGHDGDLCITLQAYLEQFGNVRAAAEALYVHTSTFRYRMRRVVEVSGLDLDDPDQRLEVAIALRLERLLRA